jgi:Asfivirus cysteine protease S273R
MKTVKGGKVPLSELDKRECFVQFDGVCATPKIVEEMHKFLKKEHDMDLPKKAPELVKTMKSILGVETEAEILEHNDFKRYVGTREVQKVLDENFKGKQPDVLLDNFNIDEYLEKLAKNSKELFGKKFYHIPFQMIDFQRVGSELARVSVPDLIKGGFDSFGCVLNTDVSSGGGKHWFCVYGDLEHSGKEKDPYRIEFFNSSGNPAVREVNLWLENTCADIMKTVGGYAESVRAAPRKLQWSKTECGMWSLVYIKSRLEGNPSDYYYKTKANDKDMIQLRNYLFREIR